MASNTNNQTVRFCHIPYGEYLLMNQEALYNARTSLFMGNLWQIIDLSRVTINKTVLLINEQKR